MPSYAAFLGHQPTVSLAELSVAIPDFELRHLVGKKIALFEGGCRPVQEYLDELGGTVLFAEKLPLPANLQDIRLYDTEKQCIDPKALTILLDTIPKILSDTLKVKKRGQVTFSLRTHGLEPKRTKELYRLCKQFLRYQGRPSRYVGNERNSAATVLLHDAGLLEGKEGCELVVVIPDQEEKLPSAAKTLPKTMSLSNRSEVEVWIGRSIAAQDPDWYAYRDMEKPVRDTRVGLLPPKLAQVMLNFGYWLAPSNTFTVYDPFCGTGVIPMEALLKGWEVLASDKSLKAVNGTKKNIEWLRKEEKILKKDAPSRVWKQDACKPFELNKNEEVDVIVTETTLGPPLEKRASPTIVKKFKSENEKLQEAFLKNAAASLPKTPIVCTWPVWYTKSGPIFLEKVWDAVKNAGFEAVLPKGIQPTSASRPSLLYRRPDQFVGREIVLLKPKV